MKLKSYFKLRKFILISTIVLSLNALSFAGLFDSDRASKPTSLGVRSTYSKASNNDEGNYFAGLQLREMIASAFVIEGSIDYREENFKLGNKINTMKSYPVQATLIAYLSPYLIISPYVLAGAGWYFKQFNGDLSLEANNKFGVHTGFGLEIMLTDHISIDGSYRYIWLEDMKTQDSTLENKNFNDGGNMISLAVNILI